jgi:two-component system, LytTR family, sensor histidine kinase AlgZ
LILLIKRNKKVYCSMPLNQVPTSPQPAAATVPNGPNVAGSEGMSAAEFAVQSKEANLKAAAASEAKTRRIVEGGKAPILPDCCNVGIALRIFIAVNGAVALFALVVSQGFGSASTTFLEAFVLVEPVLLLSLAATCGARKAFNGAINGKSHQIQWTAGIGIPVVVTMICGSALWSYLAVSQYSSSNFAYWLLARMLVAAGAAWFVIEFLRLRVRAFAPSLSEARLQALQARIRPHFLFNSLNTVLGLMRSDPRKAEKTLENLSDLFRVFMRDTRELIALEEEVYTCREYLAIEKLRLAPRLEAKWNTEEMPGDALLPSLLLQPLIENAVHHGIEPRMTPGLVEVTLKKVGDRVHIEILNPIADHVPANSLPMRQGNQMALSNVRERLMLLYDMEAELKTGVENGLFRLVLEFPYKKERRRRDVRRNFDPDC